MLKNLTLVAFMLVCLGAVSVSAQTGVSTEKQAVIKELVALINADNKLEEMTDAMASQLLEQQNEMTKAMINGDTHLSAAEKKKLIDSSAANRKDLSQRLMSKVTEKINYNEVMNEIIAAVYDKHYTLEELKDLMAFYSTPTGRKVLKTLTPVSVDTMTLIRQRLTPTMVLAVKEVMDENNSKLEQKLAPPKPKP